MEGVYYEAHHHPEPDFPIIFRFDTVCGKGKAGYLHWHEALEFLWCTEGEGVGCLEGRKACRLLRAICLWWTHRLHTVYTQHGLCRYYCLIPSTSLFERHGTPGGRVPVVPRVTDPEAHDAMARIVREMERRAPYYREAVRALIFSLYVTLYRTGVKGEAIPSANAAAGRSELVKQVVSFACSQYTEPFRWTASAGRRASANPTSATPLRR